MAQETQREIGVYPTLIVGVGGTGCKIAKRLKRTLHAEGANALNIQFVGIDTDLSESTARNEAELPLDRFVSIGGQPVHFDPKDKTNAPILSWLPTDPQGHPRVSPASLGAGQGAGGHRLVGRFAYNYFAPDAFLSLQQTIDQLVSLGNNPLAYNWENLRFRYLPGLAVYVVGSLVGGTGSGVFLDAIATLHRYSENALHDQKRFFTGLFLLPSVFDYRAIGSQGYDHKATAYACLKDLDLLLSHDDDPDLTQFWYYNQPEPFRLRERLLDSAYLIDRYSGSGALQRDEDVYDFVATHLYASIGTPFGASQRSVENNSHKTDIVDEHGGKCAYSAFGLVGMDYSQKLLRRYCAARLSVEAIDMLLGSDLPVTSAESDAQAFLQQIGLAGGRSCRIPSILQSDIGLAYIKKPEEMEDQRTVELQEGLANGLKEFQRALESGNLRSELQKNYRDHLLSVPGEQRAGQLLPGQAAPLEPQRWRHRLAAHIEESVRRGGLLAGRQLALALQSELERSFQDFETGLAEQRNNVQTAQAAFNTAQDTVRGLTPAVQLFRKQHAREVKRNAVLARNAAVQVNLRLQAAELARQVFTDDTDGLLRLVGGLITEMDRVIETLQTVRATLNSRAETLQNGSHEGGELLGAPDRSVLLYDVLPGNAFPQMYAQISDRRRQLLDTALEGRSALRLLEPIREENKAVALAERLSSEAEKQFPELTDRHILDVITEGAKDPVQRLERLRKYLRDIAPRLRPHAPITMRRGEAHTYDYCVVLFPLHTDEALNTAFRTAAEETLREINVPVVIVPTEGANNRIIATYMQHGIPLNSQAFPQLTEWMRAYENLQERNPYLDVDKRWMKYPGPGQERGGTIREKLFTLGLAYGLIAQQGGYFYVNFQNALLRHDARATNERDQYEVDLTKLADAIHASPSPLDWFKAITRGASTLPTIPAHFGAGLAEAKQTETRDRIEQGRTNALRAFVEDIGEDYQDVAEAIAAVMEAYAEERGRAEVRRELEWYKAGLDTQRHKSPELAEEYQKEINLLDELLETLAREGHFNLPLGK